MENLSVGLQWVRGLRHLDLRLCGSPVTTHTVLALSGPFLCPAFRQTFRSLRLDLRRCGLSHATARCLFKELWQTVRPRSLHVLLSDNPCVRGARLDVDGRRDDQHPVLRPR